MLRIKEILFPCDIPPQTGPLQAAVEFTRHFQARLHFFHTIVLHGEDPYNLAHQVSDPRELLETLSGNAREAMTKLTSGYRKEGMNLIREQRSSVAAAPAILEYAREREIDLIVMGTHGRRGIREIVMGSTTDEVVRMAPCPVLTVRSRELARLSFPFRNILVPMDFSGHARLALNHAHEIARVMDARIALLHVIVEQALPSFYFTGNPNWIEYSPDLEEKARKEMAEVVASLDIPPDRVSYRTARGLAGREIIAASGEGIDLIVIATHGLTGIGHLLLGSVAEKVIRFAEPPVLTVKPYGRSLISRD